MSDIKNILKEAEDLYASITDDSTERSKQIRKGLETKIEKLKKQFDNIESDITVLVKTTAKDTDKLIRDNPYPVLAVAFSIGLILAIMRKD